MNQQDKNNSLSDCRGCGAKLASNTLSDALEIAYLSQLNDFPEDSFLIASFSSLLEEVSSSLPRISSRSS